MENDKERLQAKGLTWQQFEKRIDGIFHAIEKLIKETNGDS